MEEKLDLLTGINNIFVTDSVDPNTLSPLTLAFVGDGVYELVIRTLICERHNVSPNKLHKIAVKYDKATAQAALIESIYSELTPEEEAVYKRGRNTKSNTKAKNATAVDYRKATGFEALMGYLYLAGRTERMLEIIEKGTSLLGIPLKRGDNGIS